MRSSGLVLFTCAGLLLVSINCAVSGGAILGGATAWSLLRISYYFWTTDLGLELGSGVLFITGAMLCLPACWLCTIVPYHAKSHSLMATLMALASVSMLLLSLGLSSATSLSRAVREPAAVNTSMLQALGNTFLTNDPNVKSSFAAMQLELRCCGVNSYRDWYKYRSSLPPSCCGRVWNGKGGDQCKAPLNSMGCLRVALLELRAYINAVSIIAGAIIMVLGVTLFTAAYSLVTGVVDRSKPQPLRIACLAQPPTPLVSFTTAPQNASFRTPPAQAQLQTLPALM